MNQKQSNDGHFYVGVFTGMAIGMTITGLLSFVVSDVLMLIASLSIFIVLRGVVYKSLLDRGVSLEVVRKQREEYRKSDPTEKNND